MEKKVKFQTIELCELYQYVLCNWFSKWKHLQIMSPYKLTSKTHSLSTEDLGKFFIVSMINWLIYLLTLWEPFWTLRCTKTKGEQQHQLSQPHTPFTLHCLHQCTSKLTQWVCLNLFYISTSIGCTYILTIS